jgi:ornithine cyclodeaminase
MSAPDTRWISEDDVGSLMGMGSAIDSLKRGLALEAHGRAINMNKTHISWGKGSTLHAIGAVFPDTGFAATKTWAHTPAGAKPLLILFDSNTGSLLGLMEAFALGQLRTGAVSGLATDQLASKEAKDFALIGTGKQSMMQVRAVLSVRQIKRVHVFGRNKEKSAQLAAQVEKEFGVEAVSERTIEDAVSCASIITVVTRATEPLLNASMIAPGTHVNAVGAIVPGRRELARDVFERAGMIVVDSIPQARKLSSELIDFYGQDEGRWAELQSLSAILASEKRPSPNSGITIFKSLGIGISDLALAIEIYRKAVQLGAGRSLTEIGEAHSSSQSKRKVFNG